MKKYGIYATVEHAENILELFKDRSVQFGMDNIMNIPTSGIGAVHTTPKETVSGDQWNVDMRDYIKIITSYHQLSLDQVHAFFG